MKVKKKSIGFTIYLILLMIPIYWMLNMSLRSNADILAFDLKDMFSIQ